MGETVRLNGHARARHVGELQPADVAGSADLGCRHEKIRPRAAFQQQGRGDVGIGAAAVIECEADDAVSSCAPQRIADRTACEPQTCEGLQLLSK